MEKIKKEYMDDQKIKDIFILISYLTSNDIWISLEDAKKIDIKIKQLIKIYERSIDFLNEN